jgi:uncharacterized phage protein (TIGR02218 family)
MGEPCDGPLRALAFCCIVERSDGAGIAVASHDRPLVRNGTLISPEPAVTPASITRSLGLEPHSAEMSGALTAAALTEADLLLGRWDRARVSVSALDWTDPDGDEVRLLGGELGEVATIGFGFTVELRGASAKLSAPVCPTTSAECRAELGDKKCRIDLAGRTVRARIVSSTGNLLEVDRQLDERFLFGRFRYLGGDNCGLQTAVLQVNGNVLTLRDRPRRNVAAGTRVEIREGCDKRLETCVSRFANATNFRGEPHLPGNDLLTRYPGA